MSLSVDQVYMLNCLSYLCPSETYQINPGETVGDYCQRILDSSSMLNTLTDGDFAPKSEIETICKRIVQDQTLSDMTVVATQRTAADAYGFVVTTADQSEAVVVFQGSTGDLDWQDNAYAGNKLSSPEQDGALDWYQSEEVQKYLNACDEVTVTGHSKGGNKAKYITLRDDADSVDRCLSFDGQGFSDEFMYEYKDDIAQRQDKIINYSNENDYVNILLNDVGEKHYIKSNDISNPMAYHSLFSLTDSYPMEKNFTDQNEVLASLDDAMNSYLRTLTPAEKDKFMDFFADVLVCVGSAGPQYDLEWGDLLSFENAAIVGDLLLHIGAYYKDSLILNSIFALLGGIFPWMQPLIVAAKLKLEWIAATDLPDGKDIQFESTSSGKSDIITMDTDALREIAGQLRSIARSMDECAADLTDAANDSDRSHIHYIVGRMLSNLLIRLLPVSLTGNASAVLNRMSRSSSEIADYCSDLASAVNEVAARFEETENRIKALVERE